MHKTFLRTKGPVPIAALLFLAILLSASTRAAENLLVNGGFETEQEAGTVPAGWQAWDENAGYERWIAFRASSLLNGIRPWEGEGMAAMTTDWMGVDAFNEDYDTPRAALYQTVEMPRGTRGTFSIRFNDIGSTSNAWVSLTRIGYTLENEDLNALVTPTAETPAGPGVWSERFYKVAVFNGGSGEWTRGEIPVEIPEGEGSVEVTFWIGLFDGASGTETGYWRVDDARVVAE